MPLFFILFFLHFTYSWIPDLPTHWCMNRPTPRINKNTYWRNPHYIRCCSCVGKMCFYVIYTYNLFFRKTAPTCISSYENSQCWCFFVCEMLNLEYLGSFKNTVCFLMFAYVQLFPLVSSSVLKQNLYEQGTNQGLRPAWSDEAAAGTSHPPNLPTNDCGVDSEGKLSREQER